MRITTPCHASVSAIVAQYTGSGSIYLKLNPPTTELPHWVYEQSLIQNQTLSCPAKSLAPPQDWWVSKKRETETKQDLIGHSGTKALLSPSIPVCRTKDFSLLRLSWVQKSRSKWLMIYDNRLTGLVPSWKDTGNNPMHTWVVLIK